jgi:large subunit ribosomal protein L3
VSYNNLILDMGKIDEKDINPKSGFEHYGNVKSDFVILKGSVSGPTKRAVFLTYPIRPNKFLTKKKFEVLENR